MWARLAHVFPERVADTVIRSDLMRDPAALERLSETADELRRDLQVGAAEHAQDRRLQLSELGGVRERRAVEYDGRCVLPRGRGVPYRLAAAVAEAHHREIARIDPLLTLSPRAPRVEVGVDTCLWRGEREPDRLRYEGGQLTAEGVRRDAYAAELVGEAARLRYDRFNIATARLGRVMTL